MRPTRRAREDRVIETGDRIGPYQVVGKLGAGGMGEVYRARDTKLNRDVAIKVLPEAFAADPERLARFTREAQTLAALNHPNIAHIYGVEGQALVMELVDGEDLAQRLARGPIPLEDALPIARQIADALGAAHEHAIIHRDLKPANVKVRPDGTVKVLDFGLAKAMDDGPEGAANLVNSPTFTAHATQIGMIVGTAAYMAPEQARGKAVDRRADIWAFGAVLYEMLTGRRAFDPSGTSGPPRAASIGEDDTLQDVLASVLRSDPAWTAIPADVPSSVRRLLRRCLEKDPRKRLSAIADARFDLDDQDEAAGTTAPAPRNRRSWSAHLWPALAGVLVGGLAGVLVWSAAVSPASPPLRRVSLLPPPATTLYPDSTGVAISPDGTMVAFVVGTIARSDTQIWVRSLDSMTARRLDDTDGGSLPFWSPDSRRLGFFTTSKLKTIALSGGRAQMLADVVGGGRGATWSPSGVIVYAREAGGPLYRVPATGGTPVQTSSLDATRHEYGHRFPSFLPDGDHFTYASLPGRDGKFDIFVGSLSSTTRTLIGQMESAPVYADPGELLFARQGVLVAQPFDAKTLRTTGDPVTLDDEPSMILDPATSYTAGRPTSISASGSLAYYTAPSGNTVAEWYDVLGRKTGTLPLPPGHYEHVTISPDGTRGVVVRSTSPSESTLWLVDLARGGASLLSTGTGRNDGPVWSPDGSRIVFASDRTGPEDVYVKIVGDPTPEQPLYRSSVLFKGPEAWSSDGRWIICTQLNPGTEQDVMLLSASAPRELKPLVMGPTRDEAGPVSPDGRWLAYFSDETGRYQLYVQSFPSPGHRLQVSQDGAIGAWWTPDGRQLLFVGDDLRTLSRVDVAQAGDALRVSEPATFATLPPNILWIDSTPDRQHFLALAPERTGTGSMTVVENWRAALAAK
ncbi:MAG TPA: protein kinase [Vicinamibacterales bacterium]|nr:protein kinase [Vicinamibacterales bacterium]